MDPREFEDASTWRGALVAAMVALVLALAWPGMPRSAFFIAAAAYYALPPGSRTRSNASLVGWSVGFAVVALGLLWRTDR